MTKTTTALKATLRSKAGKGMARAARREGNVPAVIYGDNQSPVMINLGHDALWREVQKSGFFNRLYNIELDGQAHRVLPRDVQFDPVKDVPTHVDFMRVSGKTKIRVGVPMHFLDLDKAPGIKRGGVLNVVAHSIEVLCSAENIPERFEISVAGLEIGSALHIEQIVLPEGVKLTSHEAGMTIATIAAPSAIRTEAREAAETAAAAAAAATAAAEAAAGTPAAPGAAPAAAAPAAGADKKEPAKK